MENTHYRITNADVKMPKIIYGTAWKKEATWKYVVEAIQAGFRGIDTACQPKHYHEEGVGDALSELFQEGTIKREDLYIQTKFTPLAGQSPHNVPYTANADLATQVKESVEVSLKNLQVNFVDSLVLHSPLFPYSHTLHVWQALELAYKEGKTKQLGISNCYDLNLLQKIYEDAEIKPSIVQNRFYNDSDYDKELRSWCKSKNIYYQSFWTLTANPHILGSETIIKLAQKYKKTQPQIFFTYLIAKGVTPLTGTTSKEHMLQDLECLDLTLEEKELQKIDELF